MGLETVTYVSDFNASWPLGTDLEKQGDDHLRNIKLALKNTFLNTFTAGVYVPSPVSSAAQALTIATQKNLAGDVVMINGIFQASVAGNALTIVLRTLAGADPSATDPVYVVFRSATVAAGDYSVLTITAATSLIISSGSTMGASNGVAFRLWIVGFNDAGTFRLGAVNCLSGTSILYLRNDTLKSSTAEGGAGAADSAQVIYTGVAVTSKPMQILGYFEWSSGLATAGTWNALATKIQLFGPGVAKPGDVVQIQRTDTAAVATGSTAIPGDDTIPQSTEGDQYMSQAITPVSAANLLHVTTRAILTNSTSISSMAMALFQDAGANAIAATHVDSAAAAVLGSGIIDYIALAALTVSTTFKVRGGGPGATTTFNGSAGGRLYGGTMNSFIQVEEIMG